MRKAVVQTGIVLVGLTLPAVANSHSGEPGSATGPAERAFTQCGDYPADFTYRLRTEGVSCSRGKNVSERYYRKAVDADFPEVVRFGAWRCTNRGYSDGEHVKCKDGSKQVRFAMGG